MANKKTYAYATSYEGTLVVGELELNGSVKIHTPTAIWGLSALKNLNELDKDTLGVNVTFKDRLENYKEQEGYLVIAWNKPKILDYQSNYHDVNDCVIRLR